MSARSLVQDSSAPAWLSTPALGPVSAELAAGCFELGSRLLERIDVLERGVVLLQPGSLCLGWGARLMIFVRLHQLLMILQSFMPAAVATMTGF